MEIEIGNNLALKRRDVVGPPPPRIVDHGYDHELVGERRRKAGHVEELVFGAWL